MDAMAPGGARSGAWNLEFMLFASGGARSGGWREGVSDWGNTILMESPFDAVLLGLLRVFPFNKTHWLLISSDTSERDIPKRVDIVLSSLTPDNKLGTRSSIWFELFMLHFWHLFDSGSCDFSCPQRMPCE